jgi:hypothetical protein
MSPQVIDREKRRRNADLDEITMIGMLVQPTHVTDTSSSKFEIPL